MNRRAVEHVGLDHIICGAIAKMHDGVLVEHRSGTNELSISEMKGNLINEILVEPNTKLILFNGEDDQH